MKSKANTIRSKLLVIVDDEMKAILKNKNAINKKAQRQLIDLEELKVEFHECFASSCHNFHIEEKKDFSNEVIDSSNRKCSRKRSIQLLYSICNFLKPIAI